VVEKPEAPEEMNGVRAAAAVAVEPPTPTISPVRPAVTS
jgi:hypothetical protein